MGTTATLRHESSKVLVAMLAAAMLLAATISGDGARTTEQLGREIGRTVSVLVQGVSADSARRAVEAQGGTVTHDLPIVEAVAAEVPAERLPALATQPGVRSVERDAQMSPQALVSPVHEATSVYPRVVRADKLWAEGVRGEGVTVAVIDTGISAVPDLAGRLIGGIDFTPEGDPFTDSFGHGTFVAGMIAGNGTSSGGQHKGVAPDADLVSVKIAGRSGASDVSHVLAALQWVVSFKDTYDIRVINLSLGTDSTQPYQLSLLNYAIQRAWDSGLVVMVSASNRGVEGPGTVTKPGDDPLVITLGATDDKGTPGRGDDVMAGFSGMGPTASNGLEKPDLVAPGRSVLSLRAPGSAVDEAYPGSRHGTAYFKGSGTSFSTGVASGAAALLLQREPHLTPDQVKHRLLSTAAPGPVGDPNVDGHGQLDVQAAAHAGTFESANQGVPRSLGTGSLNADRGTLGVVIEQEQTLLKLLLKPVTTLVQTVLDGDLTAQGTLFDYTEYLTTEWSSTKWWDSQWESTKWYSTKWYSTKWWESEWYSTKWWGAAWYAIAWE